MGPATTRLTRILSGEMSWPDASQPQDGGAFAACPVRDVIDRLLGKWTILLLLVLRDRPRRFGELSRLVPDISRRMLSQSLRELERDGMVSRHILSARPPAVEYRLTSLGQSAQAPLIALLDWAADAHGPIREARTAFDEIA
jgi:DNA-binding HxlR family transcriptional regulator